MPNSLHIFLVEDSPTDAHLIEKAIRAHAPQVKLRLFTAGDAAVRDLEAIVHADDSSTERPDLLIVDLNLPGLDGEQVVGRIKSHPLSRSTPVVVLSSSREEADVARCYLAGANSYICKPEDPAAYDQVIAAMLHYWGQVVRLSKLARSV